MQPPGFLESHLADMRLRGLSEETTIYARRCAIARLGEWLAIHCEGEPWPGAPGPVAAEDATAADLLMRGRCSTPVRVSQGP